MNEEILFFYALFAGGIVCIILSILLYFWLREDTGIEFSTFGRLVFMCLLGVGLIWYTAPSLKYVFYHDYATIKGTCTVEYDDQSSPRTMDLYYDKTDDYFSFFDRADLGAYGPDVPYTCHVTTTKDQEFEISYRLYDVKTNRLLYSSE
ncbi:hypothetical protein Exig_1447 [Exiguobacterium sibiricum 255-15]|uniref:Transmembrane protein n=1 Tax=Exiguobacterium sibiricum (strain DSM 17290 / CCUG 55495 / CIP 109462 / JCM 13490 / 255-15) TaxID=262543 RepID=B1YFY1_EXIS2|nr:hypothetical protein [Exiguobacterium sibiricum]ACB60908.1 hypothetical protein Exig_1447 [Exiguobacterium sibiricum 255-15]